MRKRWWISLGFILLLFLPTAHALTINPGSQGVNFVLGTEAIINWQVTTTADQITVTTDTLTFTDGSATYALTVTSASVVAMTMNGWCPSCTEAPQFLWEATSTQPSNPTTFLLQVSSFPGAEYRILLNGQAWKTETASAQGRFSFFFDRLWSPHSFEIERIGTGGGTGGPGSPGFALTIGYVLLDQFTVRLRAEPDCSPNCTYRWDLGDGTILQGREIVHSYVPAGLWGFYPVELRACTFDETVCETRVRSVLIVNWAALLVIVGGLLSVTVILGSSRIRGRILKAVRR